MRMGIGTVVKTTMRNDIMVDKPGKKNCIECNSDLTTLPEPLRNTHCWFFCPECWVKQDDSDEPIPPLIQEWLNERKTV